MNINNFLKDRLDKISNHIDEIKKKLEEKEKDSSKNNIKKNKK